MISIESDLKHLKNSDNKLPISQKVLGIFQFSKPFLDILPESFLFAIILDLEKINTFWKDASERKLKRSAGSKAGSIFQTCSNVHKSPQFSVKSRRTAAAEGCIFIASDGITSSTGNPI